MVLEISSHIAPLGILVPEGVLRSEAFAVAAAFVAINTVLYVALAVAKMLPKVYVNDWRRRRYERAESRSIFPEGPR
jgi:Flp pilus assembly protein TadB